ncbi:MAG: hypothetical protein COX49_09645, partial [bacterium (Candidatus Stahlbacteria) CG23_combo_of_CG06-09_8_20_14_all_40_9]
LMSIKTKDIQVTDLGLIFNKTRNIDGFDGAYSISVGNNILWLFGDTLVRDNEMICNSAIFTNFFDPDKGLERVKVKVSQDGYPVPIIEPTPEEKKTKCRIWPLHGITLNEMVYIYYVLIKVTPGDEFPYRSSSFNFVEVGSGLAKYDPIPDKMNRLLKEETLLWWSRDEGNFGSAVIDNGNYIYIFGTHHNDQLGKNCVRLLRLKKDDIEDRFKYRYLKSFKPEWTEDVNEAIDVTDDVPCEMSISYNRYLKKYLIVHSLVSRDSIVLKVSDNLWGPYEDFCTIPVKRVSPNTFRYAGKEHKELAKENGRIIYITYVESEIYWPHLLRVRFR